MLFRFYGCRRFWSLVVYDICNFWKERRQYGSNEFACFIFELNASRGHEIASDYSFNRNHISLFSAVAFYADVSSAVERNDQLGDLFIFTAFSENFLYHCFRGTQNIEALARYRRSFNTNEKARSGKGMALHNGFRQIKLSCQFFHVILKK